MPAAAGELLGGAGWCVGDHDRAGMEDNTINLVDMEGYLEVKIVADNSHPIFSHIHHRHNYDYHHPHLQQSKVKSAKMLTPNKKYWFVLSQSCLDFYENK